MHTLQAPEPTWLRVAAGVRVAADVAHAEQASLRSEVLQHSLAQLPTHALVGHIDALWVFLLQHLGHVLRAE